ncbi:MULTISPECIES: JAB domain-containing protein [unclassified Brevundimonas]|uniref:JAB domain-containing protein n=1 Tax=unclassified Brevundimonas TaxID=2622653 RepID=UPI0025BDA342|nr:MULTISPECIES: DNA repair protein RadC [unclassified Brevundimonas]
MDSIKRSPDLEITTLSPSDLQRPAQPAFLEERADAALLTGLLEQEGKKGSWRTACRLLEEFGDLAGLASADEAALARAGLGAQAATSLIRARRLAIAILGAEARRRPVLSSWSALVDYLRADLSHAPREHFRVLYLDKRNLLLREEHRAEGTVDHAPVYVREVVRRALELSASALILAHNHPSGDPAPSRADIEMTRRIVDGARLFDILVHDHVVIGREGIQSFRALGLIGERP